MDFRPFQIIENQWKTLIFVWSTGTLGTLGTRPSDIMASLYQRAKSPFWWLKFRHPETQNIERISTGFRVGVGSETKKARELRDQFSLKETKAITRTAKQEHWSTWAPTYLAARYHVESTLKRAQVAWYFLSAFFEQNQIIHPRHLNRKHCFEYVAWRKCQASKRAYRAGQNTALLDLKFLSILVKEAITRGFIEVNPCASLGLKKTRPKIKPEISDEEIKKIRDELNKLNFAKAKYDWAHIMKTSFEIALHQGCRISETYLDIPRQVDIPNMSISFLAKGGEFYTTELNPALIPLFNRLIQEGRRFTYERPTQTTMVSLYWSKFLKRIGLPHLCFHSLRVTAISRLERCGAPEQTVMQLVNHASTTVHRIYRRNQRAELQSYWRKISAPSGEGISPSSENQGSPSTNQEPH